MRCARGPAARTLPRRAAVPVLAWLLALPLASCAGGAPEPAPQTSTATPATTPDATATAPGPGTPAGEQPSGPQLPAGLPGEPQDVATGLDVPWDLAVLPDGTALVTLRDQARIVRVGPGTLSTVPAPGPDGQVPGVDPGGEGGLLGIAVSPAYARDGHVFVYTTTREDNRVIRMTHRDGRLVDPVPVLTGIPKASVHNGGRIRFGPDGTLHVGTGDAGRLQAAQDRSSLAGKVLRITADGQVPPDNPFPGSPVLSLGHRNVQGLSWGPDGRLYASEFGQDRFDELNLIEPGGNYGWPVVEGPGDGDGRFVQPLRSWGTDVASPSGIVATADAVWMAALRGQRLWRVPLLPGGAVGEPEPFLQDALGRIRTVEVGPDGSLWLLTSNTFRGRPRAGDDRLVSLPLR